MTQPRHLHVVDEHGEVLPGGCPDCKALEVELRSKRAQIPKLTHDLAQAMAVAPDHDQVLEVMVFWRSRLAPKAAVSTKMKGWAVVRDLLRIRDDETGAPIFTPIRLRAAVAGMALDDWVMDRHHRHRRYLENAFRDPGRVSQFIEDAVDFKARTSSSALTILEELGRTAFDQLADRCSCGGILLDHLKEVAPSKDGVVFLPCPERNCAHFDFFEARLNRWLEAVA